MRVFAHMAKSTDKNEISKDEQIGYHKGSLNTLMKEREELVRIVSIVEQLIQMHSSALKELGVDLNKEQPKKTVQRKKAIDEII